MGILGLTTKAIFWLKGLDTNRMVLRLLAKIDEIILQYIYFFKLKRSTYTNSSILQK